MMNDRRRFLTGLGLLLASPGVAHAQLTGKVPRVGYLFYGSPGPSREIDAFRQGLRELGYIEGHASPSSIGSPAGRLSDTRGLPPSLSV
jgi:hypothetical protein